MIAQKSIYLFGMLCFFSCSKGGTSTPTPTPPPPTPPVSVVTNPIVSRVGKTFSSAGSVPFLTDNKYGATTFAAGNNTWVAIHLLQPLTKVFFSWNSPAYTWSDSVAAANSCKSNMGVIGAYTLQKSANSTNGADGSWVTIATITRNTVTARGHSLDLAGASWLKMNITTGAGTLDEIEVTDLTKDADDVWFFPGTSITANTYKGTPPLKNYADLINTTYKKFNPIMIRGGIPCISSTDMVADLQKYLDVAGNANYWAIEMGTNDAWGGSNNNAATFKTNLQQVITACKSMGIKPVIARMIATNQTAATWQVHPDYLKAIDDLTTANQLIPGPDLYSWFATHTDNLNSDGVHPNAIGAASIQMLWAEKMDSIFAHK